MFACKLRVAAAATAAAATSAAPTFRLTVASSQRLFLRLFSSGGSHYFTGIVDRFRSDKGYGFLVTDDTRMRVYCHRSAILVGADQSSARPTLLPGEHVRFKLVSDGRGPSQSACEITYANGQRIPLLRPGDYERQRKRDLAVFGQQVFTLMERTDTEQDKWEAFQTLYENTKKKMQGLPVAPPAVEQQEDVDAEMEQNQEEEDGTRKEEQEQNQEEEDGTRKEEQEEKQEK
jgi:cold shock CspA family protein